MKARGDENLVGREKPRDITRRTESHTGPNEPKGKVSSQAKLEKGKGGRKGCWGNTTEEKARGSGGGAKSRLPGK